MIGIFNSDQRMLEAQRYLSTSTSTYLINNVNDALPIFDYLLLPMSGIRSNQVKLQNAWVNLPDDFWHHCRKDCIIFMATVNEEINQLPFKCVNLSDDDLFLSANSRLTAEGVLFLLLDNTTVGLSECKVDLLGFGHSGKEIYNLLKALDVKVRVIRRKVDHETSDFMSVSTWKQLPVSDIVINTSLTNWVDENLVNHWPKAPLILNIVSAYRMPESRITSKGGHVINAGVLPALIASKSAGRILAECVMKEMEHGE